jgi:hypothetical protein
VALPDSLQAYRVVFDASAAGYRTWWSFVPFFAIALVAFLGSRREARPAARPFAQAAAIIALVLGVVAEIGSYRECLELRGRLRAGAYEMVAGPVTDFVPEGRDGHPAESWAVDGRRYTISSAVVTSAFNRPGVVRAGQQVRIADVRGRIARLEVAR